MGPCLLHILACTVWLQLKNTITENSFLHMSLFSNIPPFSPCLISSGLQCDFLHQLFLPVLWQQRVSHDCSAVPVRGNQHRLLERPGCADRRALPI